METGVQVSSIASVYLIAAWIPSMQILLVNIVTEKSKGLRRALQCMGLKHSVFWLSWLVAELATMSLALLLVLPIGSYTRLFARSDMSLVFLIFFVFLASICTLSFFISVFFQVCLSLTLCLCME